MAKSRGPSPDEDDLSQTGSATRKLRGDSHALYGDIKRLIGNGTPASVSAISQLASFKLLAMKYAAECVRRAHAVLIASRHLGRAALTVIGHIAPNVVTSSAGFSN